MTMFIGGRPVTSILKETETPRPVQRSRESLQILEELREVAILGVEAEMLRTYADHLADVRRQKHADMEAVKTALEDLRQSFAAYQWRVVVDA